MIKFLGLLGITTYTFTNVTGPPTYNYYNNGLVDYYISYEIAGDDDSQNNTFWYTSPLMINEYLSSNSIPGFNGDTILFYGDEYYTQFIDNTPVGTNQETVVFIEGNRSNFFLDINDELSSTIDINVDGERVSYDYDISVDYRLINTGFNDDTNLIYPRFNNKSISFSGSNTGSLNYLQLFVDSIYEHTSSDDYISLIYINDFDVDINCYSDLWEGNLTISLDNNYSRTDSQYFYMNEYNNYLDEFLQDVAIPDFNLSDYLIDSVGGFMDFEFSPGVSFGAVLGIILAFGLVFIIIKYFAGG